MRMQADISAFLSDALRDQDTIRGLKMEVSPISRTSFQVKIWPSHVQGPPEYYSVKITKHV